MSAPRLQIDLDKIHHNASSLVNRLAEHGIAVTGVTKASLGSADIAATMLKAGVQSLGDSRIENLESLHAAGLKGPKWLIRSPMMSEAGLVVGVADTSLNTELVVLRQLSRAAEAMGLHHRVILMIELGDLREGIMPKDLDAIVGATLRLPNLRLAGLGTNLACRNGIAPDATNMGMLSSLADSIESRFHVQLETVSGGNSSNLAWALSGADTGRINHLRLGESILLGRDPLSRRPIPNLFTDAIILVAEVIESKDKPSKPWGTAAEASFGRPKDCTDLGVITQAILAVGRQDVDEEGLQAPAGIVVLAASSDHLIVSASDTKPKVGDELAFELNYSALLRAMTSPFVSKTTRGSNLNPLETSPA